MTALLILVWLAAGVCGLSGVGPARGVEAVADYAFAAVLGPCAFLISFLAQNATLEGEPEPADREEAVSSGPRPRG